MSLLYRSLIALALALAPFPAPHAAEAPLDPCATKRGALSPDRRTAEMCTASESVHPLTEYGDQKQRYLPSTMRSSASGSDGRAIRMVINAPSNLGAATSGSLPLLLLPGSRSPAPGCRPDNALCFRV